MPREFMQRWPSKGRAQKLCDLQPRPGGRWEETFTGKCFSVCCLRQGIRAEANDRLSRKRREERLGNEMPRESRGPRACPSCADAPGRAERALSDDL